MDESGAVDDENTLEEQEQNESRDYADELDDLKNEGTFYQHCYRIHVQRGR